MNDNYDSRLLKDKITNQQYSIKEISDLCYKGTMYNTGVSFDCIGTAFRNPNTKVYFPGIMSVILLIDDMIKQLNFKYLIIDQDDKGTYLFYDLYELSDGDTFVNSPKSLR